MNFKTEIAFTVLHSVAYPIKLFFSLLTKDFYVFTVKLGQFIIN